jgi:predicted amidophosphoribosyltransferase
MHHLKEMGISALARPIGSALAGSLASLLSQDSIAPAGPVWLVPVASGVKSLQKRGYSPASLIGKALLAEAGAGPRLLWGAGLVWRQRDVADQAGLTGLARQTNLVGVMRASARAANRSIVLVDDIVTTGSTLFETARALRAEGAHVVGFVTFAETILRSFAKSDAGD